MSIGEHTKFAGTIYRTEIFVRRFRLDVFVEEKVAQVRYSISWWETNAWANRWENWCYCRWWWSRWNLGLTWGWSWTRKKENYDSDLGFKCWRSFPGTLWVWEKDWIGERGQGKYFLLWNSALFLSLIICSSSFPIRTQQGIIRQWTLSWDTCGLIKFKRTPFLVMIANYRKLNLGRLVSTITWSVASWAISLICSPWFSLLSLSVHSSFGSSVSSQKKRKMKLIQRLQMW